MIFSKHFLVQQFLFSSDFIYFYLVGPIFLISWKYL